MTPPPAATIAGRGHAPAARRPATARARSSAAPARPRAIALPSIAGLRIPRPSLHVSTGVAALRRVLSGRGVIVVLGVTLLGLVFLQVSLLRLNSAISVNVEKAAGLERANAQARATMSKLDAGRRIQAAAGRLGLVMPAAGSICFLDAGRRGPCVGGDVKQAGAGIDPVADVAPATAPAVPVSATPAPQATAPAQPVTSPATTEAPAPVAQQTQPAPATPAPAATTPAPAPQAQAGSTGGLAAATSPGG